jgi:hypothetical protein
MKVKKSEYTKILDALEELKLDYPGHTLGQHLSIALADYGDMWNITDREFLFAIEKYATELELNIVSDADVDRIVKEGSNLETLFNEEEEDYE